MDFKYSQDGRQKRNGNKGYPKKNLLRTEREGRGLATE